jgi:hypothetical protein
MLSLPSPSVQILFSARCSQSSSIHQNVSLKRGDHTLKCSFLYFKLWLLSRKSENKMYWTERRNAFFEFNVLFVYSWMWYVLPLAPNRKVWSFRSAGSLIHLIDC